MPQILIIEMARVREFSDERNIIIADNIVEGVVENVVEHFVNIVVYYVVENVVVISDNIL